MDKLNIINDLILSLCSIVVFISLFKFYYISKGHLKKDVNKESFIRIISFFIFFFLLFCSVNFYITSYI